MLLRKNWREHLPWVVGTLVLAVLSVLEYSRVLAGTTWDRRPTGSTTALFLFGVAGGSICLFEFLLWPRKRWRVLRLGRAQWWMRAHIWLGLLAVPLLVLHSGFYFRNLEATLLLLLFLGVIASGVWGLYMQNVLPSRMLAEVPAETIYSQISHISNMLVEEADRMVMQTCGITLETEEEGEEAEAHRPDHRPNGVVTAARKAEEALSANAVAGSHYTVGAVRTIGGIQGKMLETRAALPAVPDSEPLREFFQNMAGPYLKSGAASRSSLADPLRSRGLFNELRLLLNPAAHDAVNALENLVDQRRQFDQQARLHYWLHNWLWVHLPMSVALIVLMFVHIYKTLQYWWPS